MSYGYNVHAFLYQANKQSVKTTRSEETPVYGKQMAYPDLLSKVRKELADAHANELMNAVGTEKGEENMRGIIIRYINEWHVHVAGHEPSVLVDRLYEDMFGFSFLTKYLRDPNIQEINCNCWDDVEVCTNEGWHKLTERFLSPIQAADITKRMALLGGLVLDGASPSGDSYITEGVRIHAKLPPVIDDADGVQFSIRKQRAQKFTEKELVSLGTATQDMLDLLKLCLRHGVSVGFCGNTGSGKTTDLDWLLSTIPDYLRVYTIEDTRELSQHRRDDEGNIINRVMHTKTRFSDGSIQNVDARQLVRDALRCDPDIIVPSEMRGAEAMEVMEASRTGHTLASTFHAESAKDAYSRIVSMAMMGNTAFSETMLLNFAYQSFPIICHKRRLSDGNRKYVEICEAVETEYGYEVIPLFRFAASGNRIGKNKMLQIRGKHVKESPISDRLAEKLLLGGASDADIAKFARDGYLEERRKRIV